MGIYSSFIRIGLTRSIKPFQFTNQYDKELSYQNTKNLGLYIHIPFCKSICSFCPYCKVKYNKTLAEDYVEALKQEIHLVGAMSPNKKEVTSLYFGGGTPALVIDELESILNIINKYFMITQGIGLELHPSDVTIENLNKLKAIGVTKISIGIQSFQDQYLDLLGRKEHHYKVMFEALKQVKFETVAMDFIFGLPHQTLESLKKDIDIAFSNGANHFAIYPFIDFTYTQRTFEKMKEKDKKKLLDEIVDYCTQQGYTRDSIWTFGKKNVQKYSSMTRDNFLGFGCSATTLLEDQFKINTFSIPAYVQRIKEQQLPTSLTLKFTQKQRMLYYLFWRAYTTKINTQDFYEFFNQDLEKHYGKELKLACLLKLAYKKDNQYYMTNKGAYYYHYYENYFTLAYIDQMWNVMRNNNFPQELIIK